MGIGEYLFSTVQYGRILTGLKCSFARHCVIFGLSSRVKMASLCQDFTIVM